MVLKKKKKKKKKNPENKRYQMKFIKLVNDRSCRGSNSK